MLGQLPLGSQGILADLAALAVKSSQHSQEGCVGLRVS